MKKLSMMVAAAALSFGAAVFVPAHADPLGVCTNSAGVPFPATECLKYLHVRAHAIPVAAIPGPTGHDKSSADIVAYETWFTQAWGKQGD